MLALVGWVAAPTAQSDEDSETSTITFAVVSNRCDPHAVAEDTRGTVFPLTVAAGDASGLLYVAVSDNVRAALYGFVTEACAG